MSANSLGLGGLTLVRHPQVQPPPASAHSSPRRVMSSDTVQSSPSNTSLNTKSSAEDWDHASGDKNSMQTNSVAFPGEGKEEEAVPVAAGSKLNRTLSDLLKLHAEKGTRFACSPEEATRLADVLGQWINSSSSPYEADDDFFAQTHAQDDSSLPSAKRTIDATKTDSTGRPRGQSESVVRLSNS